MSDIPVTAGGEGPANAYIAVVGEALGREEHEQKRPFVGAAGKLLNAMLAVAQLRREDVYITNVVKVRPPDNKLERLPEMNLSVQDYIPLLRHELESVNPRVVIGLGDMACYTLTGKRPITKWRGSVLPCTLVDGLKVVPTLHPAYVLRDYSMHPVVILDIQRARKESKSRAYERFQPTLILQPSLHTVLEYIEKCHAEKTCSFDVETYGPRIRCLGLAATEDTAVCIPFKRGPTNVWPESDEYTIWQAVRRLFADPAVCKVAQNAQFDLHFLVPHTGFPVGPLFDTMLAHHLLHPELPHDLDFLTSIYTNIGYYGLGNVMRAPDMDCWVYNCHDVLATLQVKNHLVQELEARKLTRFFQGYTMPLSVCLYEMQHRGVGIDESSRSKMIEQLTDEAEKLRTQLNETAGKDLNPSSPKQLQDYFYGERGYKQNYNRKRHTVTVDRTALMKIAAEGSQVANIILDIRAREKLVSTFLDIPLAPDGRLHCEYVISGTVTGRLSSRAPLTGFGCLPPDTEVLTPIGWINIPDFESGSLAMTWSPEGYLRFQPCDLHVDESNLPMVTCSSTFHNGVYTPDHRIPVLNKHLNFVGVEPAGLAATRRYWALPISGQHVTGFVSLPWIRLFVAYIADGSYSSTQSIRFGLLKQRKIDRLLDISESLGCTINEQSPRKDGLRRFNISGDAVEILVKFTNLVGKGLDKWVLTLDNDTLAALVNELRYWDATVRGRSFMFFTTDSITADWAATASHLVGYSSTTRVDTDNNSGYGQGNNKPLYTVAIKPRAYARIEDKHWSAKPYSGKIYCLVTPTTFFLCRRKGLVFITGNTNLQNIPRPDGTDSAKCGVRSVFVPKSGCVFVKGDLSQAENRVVAWLTKGAMKRAFERGEDVHMLTAQMIDSVRSVGKVVNHASNYGMGPGQLAALLNCDMGTARKYLDRYHYAYQEVHHWHERIRKQLAKDRTLRTPVGRVRKFLGRWGDDLFRAAYSFVPQSLVADVLNMGMLRLWLALKEHVPEASLVLQVHDEVVVETPRHNAEQVQALLHESLEYPVLIESDVLVIPVDSKILSQNWLQ